MRHFHDQLQDLLKKIVQMGTLAESMIEKAIGKLIIGTNTRTGGADPVATFFESEQQVNALQVEVDEAAVQLTVLHQPMAGDARFLFMASRIAGELERVGDHAVNIIQCTAHLRGQPSSKRLAELSMMAQAVRKMVRDSLTAMINRDVVAANKILTDEKQVDALHDRIFSSLLSDMTTDPHHIEEALSLILISQNLERIGDHATNIAEEAIYCIQGRDVRHGQALDMDEHERDEENNTSQTQS